VINMGVGSIGDVEGHVYGFGSNHDDQQPAKGFNDLPVGRLVGSQGGNPVYDGPQDGGPMPSMGAPVPDVGGGGGGFGAPGLGAVADLLDFAAL
jgi:hypothetical protein